MSTTFYLIGCVKIGYGPAQKKLYLEVTYYNRYCMLRSDFIYPSLFYNFDQCNTTLAHKNINTTDFKIHDVSL